MRAVFLAGLLLASAGCATGADPFKFGGEEAAPRLSSADNSPLVRATAPGEEAEAQTYESPMDALLSADLDHLVASARAELQDTRDSATWGAVVFIDEFAAGRWERARAVLEQMPDGLTGSAADMFEPFLLAAEGEPALALERMDHGAGGLPDPLPEIERALLLEGMGRLDEAGAAYRAVIASIDVGAPSRGEPQDEAALMRALTATRTSQVLYRAALTQHRLGHAAEAGRLYDLVATFTPQAADLLANRARLARGEAPFEPALDTRRALGRWLLFVSDFLQVTEGVATILTSPGPIEGLASPAGSMFLQFGILLDPSAEDWTLGAAAQLIEARGYGGAERILNRIASDGVYAADAQLARANLKIKQREDDAAVAAARQAIALGGERWSVLAGAGDIFRLAGEDSDSIAAHSRALTLANAPRDRADVLSYRAFAHRFAGRIPDAVRDADAALALDREDDIRYVAVSILMDGEEDWRRAIGIAREMFAERPDSTTRLNSLGYALIQRPEGLEEGYRLLWRGFSFRDTDYSVVDSLGWAYYLHGAFDEARVLIERANDLSRNEPNPEILDHLGDVYWRLGEGEQARETWTEALAARPDAIRRAALERKVAEGMESPAPARRALPRVELPSGPRERGDT